MMEEASQSSGGKKEETKVKTEKQATGVKEEEISGGKKEKVVSESKETEGKKMMQTTGGKKREKENGGKMEKAESSQSTKENERMGKVLKKVNMVLAESVNKPIKPKIIVLYYRGIKKRTLNEGEEEPGTSENPIELENTQ